MTLRKIGLCLVSLLLSATLIMPQTIHATEIKDQPNGDAKTEQIMQEVLATEEPVGQQENESKSPEVVLPSEQPTQSEIGSPELPEEELANKEVIPSQEPTEGDVKQLETQEPSLLSSLAPKVKSAVYEPNFTIRARNIMTANPDKGTEYLQQGPATYRIENMDGTLSFTGTSSTYDAYSNFVHWTMEKGEGNYLSSDDTRLHNLPNGDYKVTQVYAGKNITADGGRSSSTPYFNASQLESAGQYYTFSITDELVDNFMNDVKNNGQGNSVFFGFYNTIPDPNQKLFVMFDANGGRGTMSNMRDIPQNSTVTLLKNRFYNDGADFVGWNTVKNPTPENPGIAYADEALLALEVSDVQLYAQWKIQENYGHEVYILDRTSGYGSKVKSKTVSVNGLAYSNEELDELVEVYKTKNSYGSDIGVVKSEIRVKQGSRLSPDQWNLYSEGMKFENKETIAYLIYIDKVEEKITVTFNQGLHGQLAQQNDMGQVVYEIKKGTSLEDNKITLPLIMPDENYEVAAVAWDKEISLTQQLQEDVVYTAQYVEKKPVPTPTVTPTTTPETPVTPQQPDPVVPEIPRVIPQPIVVPPVVEEEQVQNTPTPEVIPDQKQPENLPAENIDEETNPLLGAKGSWALINLICALVTMLIAIILLVSKHQREQDNKQDQQSQQDQQETTEVQKRRRWTKVAGVLVTAVSIILFVLTENMRLPMVLVDRWTIWMVALLISQCVVFFVGRSWKEENDDEDENELTPQQ